MHHLKKQFSEDNLLLIEKLNKSKRSTSDIAKVLNCSFYRVQREIEIITFRNKQNEKPNRNRANDRSYILPKTGELRLHRSNL